MEERKVAALEGINSNLRLIAIILSTLAGVYIAMSACFSYTKLDLNIQVRNKKMERLFGMLRENKQLAALTIVLTLTIFVLIYASLWVFSQQSFNPLIGYVFQLLAGLFIVVAKIAYSAGAEESQYKNCREINNL
jgi:uncharacterized membrane protein YedE/YeeE